MFVHNNKVVDCWFAQARCMSGITPEAVHRDVVELEDTLRGWGAEPEPAPDRMELDEETLEELRALGYVE